MADARPTPSDLAAAPTNALRCAGCRHFMDDRETVERELPGLLTLSSAFGDSWGDAGLCRWHDLMILPDDGCTEHTSVRPPPVQSP